MSERSFFDNVTAWYEEGRHCEKGRLKALVVRNPKTGCSARLDIAEAARGREHHAPASFVHAAARHRHTCECAFGSVATIDPESRRRLLDGARGLARVRIDGRWLAGELDIRDDRKTAHVYRAAAEHMVALMKGMGVPLPAEDQMPEIVVHGEPTIKQIGSRSRWVSIWSIQGIKTEVHNFGRR